MTNRLVKAPSPQALTAQAMLRVTGIYWRLYIPGDEPIQTETDRHPLVERLRNLELDAMVEVKYEDLATNREFISSYLRDEVTDNAPYLEKVIGGSSAGVLYFLGDEIEQELREVRRQSTTLCGNPA